MTKFGRKDPVKAHTEKLRAGTETSKEIGSDLNQTVEEHTKDATTVSERQGQRYR